MCCPWWYVVSSVRSATRSLDDLGAATPTSSRDGLRLIAAVASSVRLYLVREGSRLLEAAAARAYARGCASGNVRSVAAGQEPSPACDGSRPAVASRVDRARIRTTGSDRCEWRPGHATARSVSMTRSYPRRCSDDWTRNEGLGSSPRPSFEQWQPRCPGEGLHLRRAGHLASCGTSPSTCIS